MKVAVIDNTCNNGYVIMRYLNNMGIDTDLLLFDKPTGHADPTNDTYNNQHFDKIINTEWTEKGLISFRTQHLKKLLDQYDFIIGSDYSPAIFYKIKRNLDIYFPHGTDLFNYPFTKFPLGRDFRKKIGSWLLAKNQRRGITDYTKYLVFDLTNEENEAYIRKLKKPKFKRKYLTTPLIYIPQYTDSIIENFAGTSRYVQTIKTLKEEGHLIIFHHCQQQWKNPYHSLFNKGNDKLIRGLSLFVKAFPEKKIRLVMIERGLDIENSKLLIKELGLDDYIIWLPFMPRKEIMACLSFTDIGVGELGHSWYTYSVVSEFMAMGIPIVHKCDIDYYKTVHDNIYPMYTADTENDIFTLLSEYCKNPDTFKETGLMAKTWYKENILNPFMDFVRKSINEKINAEPIN